MNISQQQVTPARHTSHEQDTPARHTSHELKSALLAINHKSYPAYKSIKGTYRFDHYFLSIDHVQGDPFASPSKIHVEIPGKTAGFPSHLYDSAPKRTAFLDYLIRIFGAQLAKVNHKAAGSGKSGLITISRCGQEILERSCCSIEPASGSLLVRMEVGFPANGRSINAPELIRILFDFLPACITKTLLYQNRQPEEFTAVLRLCENQEYIRAQLIERKLAAFVADGSILPRMSGISDKPMTGGVPFASPSSLKTVMHLPHGKAISGMGIPNGITLIVGGGFHGKSTLLRALELGVYNHISGDGREYVITDKTALKLRAEDSRYINNVDISLFINHLPSKKGTRSFSTEDASGSTSQAANVVEGMEAQTSLFLIDEDTSATNFMIRDELMQRVVADQEEPITPFISRVHSLYEQAGISSVIVAGSSGAYFHVADTILQMKEYEPFDITAKAKEAALDFPALHTEEQSYRQPEFNRFPSPRGELRSPNRVKIKVFSTDGIQINKSTTDLRCLEQITDAEQLYALAYLLVYSMKHYGDKKRTLQELVALLEKQMDEKGLASLTDSDYLNANLCRPRPQEIFSCFNRCRDILF